MHDIDTHEATARNANEDGDTDIIQLVVFTLDEEEYAVPIADIQEIIKVPEVTPIPNAPQFIKGILNLRGKIVVVIDLEKRFGLVREKIEELKHIIITEVGETNFGVMVNEVVEVLSVPSSVVQPTPKLVSSKIHADYLKGVVVLKETEHEKEVKEVEETRKEVVAEKVEEKKEEKTEEEEASVEGEVHAVPEPQKDTGTEEPQTKQTEFESNGSRLLILIDLSKILREKDLVEATESVEVDDVTAAKAATVKIDNS